MYRVFQNSQKLTQTRGLGYRCATKLQSEPASCLCIMSIEVQTAEGGVAQWLAEFVDERS